MSAQLDAGQREEAMRTGTAAIQLARKRLPDQVVPTFKLLVCAIYGTCTYTCNQYGVMFHAG